MHKKYPNLLSPIKVGNTVLRNRMIATASRPHFVQGAEPYPTDGIITHFANKAQSGAALVTVNGASLRAPESKRGPKSKTMWAHWMCFDIYDSLVQHYLSQLSEAIHFYGAKATMDIDPNVMEGYDVCAGASVDEVMGDGGAAPFQKADGKELPVSLMREAADRLATQALILKETGFDGIYLHMSYRAMLLARFLSPLTNKRTDEFGGSLENRIRFPLMVCDRIKEVCGKDFLIEASISVLDPEPDGWTIQDTIQFAKLAEGHIDMIQLRSPEIDPNHPTGFELERTPFLSFSETVKKGGVKIPIVTVGGYQDPDLNEQVIALRKADIIGMARSWISNSDYGIKVYEDRSEDIVPCIRCNKCHRSSNSDPWISVCSVNPVWGLEHRIDKMIKPVFSKKKIAIVGGGPAGMEAALIAADRGHKITLYEKSNALGGQLKVSDNVSFKWPLKDFKNYLIRQIEKRDIKVFLNTEASADTLLEGNYDTVLVAIGSEPIIPQIPGVEGENVIHALDVYENEETLAKEIVIIGGGEIGVETGMHLAENGHNVIVLEMLDELAANATPVHYRSMFINAWEKLKNFKYRLNARCTSISPDSVAYVDNDGSEHIIDAGTVVLAVGMKAKKDKALELFEGGDKLFFNLIGDCNKVGNVQTAMRNAFGIASML